MRRTIKQLIRIFVFICYVFTINCYAEQNSLEVYRTSTTEIIKNLEGLDIIRNSEDYGDSKSYIKRRDILEKIYIIKSSSREFVINPIYRTEKELTELKDKNPYKQGVSAGYKNYSDVRDGSYDDYLITSAEYYFIFNGKKEEENHIADLDSDATIHEALTFIGYLFKDTCSGWTMTDYFNLAEELELINTDKYIYSLQVTPNQLTEKITAYDFFNILYRALYVPNNALSDWGSELDVYYINRFSERYQHQKNSEIENIIN